MAIKGSIGRDQKVCNCFMPLLFGGALSWHNTSKERILSLGGGVVSAFSEYLNNCINKYLAGSELSKNDLISTCKVNRSTFFQCMRGMRVPTQELFQTLLEILQLSPGEEAKLRQLYYIAQIGEPVYQSRQWARKCLETLAVLSAEGVSQIHQFAVATHITAARAAIYGEDQIFQELCQLAQAEIFLDNPQIDLFLPRYDAPFFEYLKVLYRGCSDKSVRLRQLIQFPQKKEEKAKASLEFLHFALFFLASSNNYYEAYYYYSDAEAADVIGVLYPYSVITSTSVLLINETMDQGLFSTTPEILEACRRQFEETMRKSRTFVNTLSRYEQIVPLLCESCDKGEQRYQFCATPCFDSYLTDKMLKKYFCGRKKELMGCFSSNLKWKNSECCFCSRKGILDFAQTGIVPNYPAELILPLDTKDRREVLQKMLQHLLKKGGIYLVDENKLTVSEEFIFTLYEDERILAYRKGISQQRVYQLQEQNLLSAFADYFQTLAKSQLVRPKAELEQVLREAIQSCSCENME